MPAAPHPAPPLAPSDQLHQAAREALRQHLADEAAMLHTRRQQVLVDAGAPHPAQHHDVQLPRVGLALSGGGVRSATFALGLLRGLASNRTQSPAAPAGLASDGLLGRVDYLSTVSGGGYIGAMWGRLVATHGLQHAQALLRDSTSPVLHWLRRNGRYLNPAGSRDTGIAIATYVRTWLAIHMEFMFACAILGLLVVTPHLVQHRLRWLSAWEPWGTPWWVLALALLFASAPGLIAGYWSARDTVAGASDTTRRPGPRELAFLLMAALCTLLLAGEWVAAGVLQSVRSGPGWLNLAVLAGCSITLGQLGVMAWLCASSKSHSLLVAEVRNRLTEALRLAFTGVLGLLALGALDWLSWWALDALPSLGNNPWLLGGVGVGGVLLLVLRNLVQPLQQMAAESTQRGGDWLPRLANVGSQLAFLLLAMGWIVVLQWFVFDPNTFDVFNGVPATWRALLLFIGWFLWAALTSGNSQMANTSSLHSFYRARLTRAYLAVGNTQRNLDSAGPNADVTSVVKGDDLDLSSYTPEARGGPIHLVNTCLNQTRDDRSNLYNADRKGTALTASARGYEVGPDEFVPPKDTNDMGTLGRWAAVSGAAASPGAGAYTSSGLALLLYLLGVRLGYWMETPKQWVQLKWASAIGWRWLPKPLMLASEASATFYGMERPWWYLSDGGHFENTGVYALLKRELDFIILSDASCDAAYEFGDLENLVRKARIDFGAEIDFYSHGEAVRVLGPGNREITVLSPEDMADNHSCRGVLLARIRYRERTGPNGLVLRPEGTLLVVKPNMHDALDVDLLAYAHKHTGFPHESTADQSFDEAQWESYHRLGEDFGRALTDDWLGLLPGWRSRAHHSMAAAARLSGLKTTPETKAEPLWRRGVRAGAIGTTLGLGASGTLVVSLWQVQDQVLRQSHDLQTETRQLLVKASEGLGTLDGACPKLPEHVLTPILDLLQRRNSPAMRPLDAKGVDRLVQQIGEACKVPDLPLTPAIAATESAQTPACKASYQRMHDNLCVEVNRPLGDASAINYWLPRDTPEQQALDSRKKWQEFARYWDALGALALRRSGTAVVGLFPVDVPPPVGPEPAPDVPATAPSFASLSAACARATGKTMLYTQVYDPASLLAANVLRERIRLVAYAPAGAAVLVAPVENVVRSAELRQQRRPTPWANPTFLLHDRGNPEARRCAEALAQFIGPPWRSKDNTVWIRDLPDRLPATPGVVELWLPPLATQNMALLDAVGTGGRRNE